MLSTNITNFRQNVFGLKALIAIIRNNPFQTPPSYEKLQGELKGAYSRRIIIKHKLVYEILEAEHTIKIISMWTHYEF